MSRKMGERKVDGREAPAPGGGAPPSAAPGENLNPAQRALKSMETVQSRSWSSGRRSP